jgi:hypothetical protein
LTPTPSTLAVGSAVIGTSGTASGSLIAERSERNCYGRQHNVGGRRLRQGAKPLFQAGQFCAESFAGDYVVQI